MDRTATFYSSPSYRFGSGIPIFSGARRQRGGSVFGSIKTVLQPVITALGRKIAKQGAKSAVGLARDVAMDALAFKNINDSVLKHGKKRALALTRFATDEGLNDLEKMIGSGRKRRRQSSGKRKRQVKKKSKPRRKSRCTKKALF